MAAGVLVPAELVDDKAAAFFACANFPLVRKARGSERYLIDMYKVAMRHEHRRRPLAENDGRSRCPGRAYSFAAC
jgi:hypothetical protein